MREFKIGDKVFSTVFGNGEVTKIDTPNGNPLDDNYPIGVTFSTDFDWYTVDGRYWSNKPDNKDIKHIINTNEKETMKCTTQSEVFEQLARVAKLIEGTDLELRNVAKYTSTEGFPVEFIDIYGEPSGYTFALALVEGKPVFAGDKLWSNYSNKEVTIEGTTVYKDNLYLTHINNAGDGGDTCLDTLTWKQPKKTFMLNSIELPLPTSDDRYYISDAHINLREFTWESARDRDSVAHELIQLLRGNK